MDAATLVLVLEAAAYAEWHSLLEGTLAEHSRFAVLVWTKCQTQGPHNESKAELGHEPLYPDSQSRPITT